MASRKRRTSRQSRRAARGRRRSGTYAPQPITRPGSRPGLVDVIEVDSRGSVLRVLERNIPYSKAKEFIQNR